MKKYQLIVMGFDGEYMREYHDFDSVDDAWEYSNNMGSKWYFYPFHFVVSGSGLTIIDCGYGFEFAIGKRVKTVARRFNELSKQEDMKDADIDTFIQGCNCITYHGLASACPKKRRK
jgi:hypothetical protein